jgi:hypothetical protein
VDWRAVIDFAGAGSLGTMVALLVVSRRPVRVRNWRFRLREADAGLLAVFPLLVLLACGAGNYILWAKTGHWTTGDFRASEWFIAINGMVIVVLVPLLTVATIWFGLRRRGR